MACNTCTGTCLCGQINISAIKGDTGAQGIPGLIGPQGIQGIPGPPGAPGGVSTIYEAWADDNTGTGFTPTPSDKCFYAITDTIAGGSPVVGDFAGKWFMINQPVTKFEKYNYLNYSFAINQAGPTTILLTTPPVQTVVGDFFNSVGSYIEFETDITMDYIGGNTGGFGIVGDINGYDFTMIDATTFGGQDTAFRHKVKLYYVDATSVYLINSYIENDSVGTEVVIGSTLLTAPITPGALITFTIQDIRTGAAAVEGTLNIRTNQVNAFNPNKLTC